jgi:hypothetical protein
MITLINAIRPADWKPTNNLYDCAEWLGLNPWAAESTSWDVFDAVLTPGNLILLISWKDEKAALAYEDASLPAHKSRVQRVRIIRDYGKYDRREAPQYYPDALRARSLHLCDVVCQANQQATLVRRGNALCSLLVSPASTPERGICVGEGDVGLRSLERLLLRSLRS